MGYNSNLLKAKRACIISVTLRIFLKYISLIVIINILQLSLAQLNLLFVSPKFLQNIIRYVLMVISPWVSLITIYVVYFEVKDGQIDLRVLIRSIFSDFKYWFITSIIFNLIMLGLTLLFLIPAIIAAFYYSFVWQVFVFEKLRNKAALDRSKKEVKERISDIAFYLIIYIVIVFITTGGVFLLRYLHINNFYISFSTLLFTNTISSYFTVLMTFVYLLFKGYLVYQEKDMKFILTKGVKI